MKVGTTLFRRPGRSYTKESKIKFKEMFPIQLKNEVSGKGQKTADVSCLQEMAVMFACMKKNDFKEVKCTPEIDGFFNCYNQHKNEAIEAQKREKSGELTIGRNARNLTTKQLNQMLQKYPQFNEKLSS